MAGTQALNKGHLAEPKPLVRKMHTFKVVWRKQDPGSHAAALRSTRASGVCQQLVGVCRAGVEGRQASQHRIFVTRTIRLHTTIHDTHEMEN